MPTIKTVIFIGSSKKYLSKLPTEIKSEIGYALYIAQLGEKHLNTKPLKGFGGNVLEIIANDAAGTYRAVYTVKFAKAIFVLHVFQKKSKHGISTPQKEIDLIKNRLKEAQQIYEEII